MSEPAVLDPATMIWMEVGEPPAAVRAYRAARQQRVLPILRVVSGVVVGGLSGFGALAVWADSFSWPLAKIGELIVGVGLPVGIAEYFFTGWFFPFLARHTELHVQKVALADGKLWITPATGAVYDWPMKRVIVSKVAVAGGWFVVSLPAGKVTLSFWVPPMVAATLAGATSG
jgi:hypothetical protein